MHGIRQTDRMERSEKGGEVMICEDIYLMREQLIDEYEKALAEDDGYKARCILEELQEMELERG